MIPIRRVTRPTVEVLQSLLDEPGTVWGLRIAKSVGRPPGSVYPILGRLEDAGWIIGCWEQETTRGGPRRRLYRLTDDGRLHAREVVVTYLARQRPSVLSPRILPAV